MRQPDNLPAFCRVHRNGRPLIGRSGRGDSADLAPDHTQISPICVIHADYHGIAGAGHIGG